MKHSERLLVVLAALLLLDGVLFSGAVRVTLSHVKTENELGWVHLRLDMTGHTGHYPQIARIDWCSASSPSADTPTINRADGTCTGRNVLHKRIYPPALASGERYPSPEELSEIVRIVPRTCPSL